MFRRNQLIMATLALLCGTNPGLCGSTAEPTGIAVRGMENLDRLMLQLLQTGNIPGGALAVGRNGRLIFNRGYGLADVEAGQAVQPDSLFRIGSVSKVFTAVAILKLVEEGRLGLEDRAFHILKDLRPAPGARVDPRIDSITVAHLLSHRAGWDQLSKREDAAMEPLTGLAAKAFGVPAPPSSQVMIRYALGRALDFDPGTKSVYSNLGYLVLGRIVEAVSGQTYERYVRQNLLEPIQIGRMRLGRSLPDGRAPGEVRYYSGSPAVQPVFPRLTGLVPVPYGGLYIEGIDSSGGWVASPADLVCFVAALDGSQRPALLKASTLDTMIQAPRPAPAGKWAYALGWAVTQEHGGLGWMKLGSTGGDCTYVRRRANGLIVAASLNGGCPPGLDEEVAKAVDQVRDWPLGELSPTTGQTGGRK